MAHIASARCTWGIFLDSDAVIRQLHAPLDDLIGNVSIQLGGPSRLDNVSAVFELESGVSPANLNSGVILFNYARVGNFFQRWVKEQKQPKNNYLRTVWPHEQGVLEKLLGVTTTDIRQVGIRDVPSIDEKVGLVQPGTMNSPNGWFIRHIWSGPGVELRETEYDNLISILNLNQTTNFNSIVDEITSNEGRTYQNITIPIEFVNMLLQQASYINKERAKFHD